MFVRAPGVVIEALAEEVWAVYSPLSGESHLLNDESVALVEGFVEDRPRSADNVVSALAAESGVAVEDLHRTCVGAWSQLLQAGLIVACPTASADARPTAA